VKKVMDLSFLWVFFHTTRVWVVSLITENACNCNEILFALAIRGICPPVENGGFAFNRRLEYKSARKSRFHPLYCVGLDDEQYQHGKSKIQLLAWGAESERFGFDHPVALT
jgi:hypothetical protein